MLLKETKLPTLIRHYYRYQERQGQVVARHLPDFLSKEPANHYQKRTRKWTGNAHLPQQKSFANLIFSGRTYYTH